MTVRHRRAVTARLLLLIGLLLAGIWYLYRHYIAVAPAPPPRVTHVSRAVSPSAHI